jgi:hypothetical protein
MASSSLPPPVKDVLQVGKEIMRIFPEGIIMGSAFYALLTFSFPFAIFSASMAEAAFILKLLKNLAVYVNATSPTISAAPMKAECRSGFRTVTMEGYSLFPSDYVAPFPSTQLYMISAALAYMLTSLSNLSKELEALGPAYASRYYVALMATIVILLFFSIFRMYNSCDGIFGTMFSIIAGLLIGGLLVLQNRAIFGSYGSNAVNMLGIPLLANRAANGQTLYLCPTTTAGRG